MAGVGDWRAQPKPLVVEKVTSMEAVPEAMAIADRVWPDQRAVRSVSSLGLWRCSASNQLWEA